jgi:hypothetical protein
MSIVQIRHSLPEVVSSTVASAVAVLAAVTKDNFVPLNAGYLISQAENGLMAGQIPGCQVSRTIAGWAGADSVSMEPP